MRAWHPLPALLLILAAGCGGGSSSSGSSGSQPATAQQKQQALSFTSSFLSEASAYSTPDTFTPPALRGGSLPDFAQAFAMRGASLPLPARAMMITPCAGNTSTTGPDANGYTTATTDFGACTDGTSGQIVTRWKLTADTFDLTVTFNDFSVSAVVNGGLVTEDISGSVALSSTHAGNVWTTHYTIPGLTVDAMGNGTTLHITHDADLTATFTRTSTLDQPVVGDYSVYGHSHWNNGLATFTATIDQATPLLWKDLGSGSACPYPVSGRIAYDISGRAFGVTFTSVCGVVTLDGGGSVDLHNY